MERYRSLILLTSAIIISGCVESKPKMTPEQVRAVHESQCLDYGFKEGSKDYANCLLELDKIRAADELAKKKAIQDYVSDMANRNRNKKTRCTNYGNRSDCVEY